MGIGIRVSALVLIQHAVAQVLSLASVCVCSRRAPHLFQERRPTSDHRSAGGHRPRHWRLTRRPGRPEINCSLQEESWGKVVAIDPGTGATKWEHKVLTPPWGGVMATAGNLVFGGTIEGVVFALNAATGERLWTFAPNGPIFSAPISYLANGRQLVSIPAGDVLITFALD